MAQYFPPVVVDTSAADSFIDRAAQAAAEAAVSEAAPVLDEKIQQAETARAGAEAARAGAEAARDEAQAAAAIAGGTAVQSAAYDAETDALVLTNGIGAEVTAPFNGVFMPSIIHDYTHGIPFDKLMPATGYDDTGVTDVHSQWMAAMHSAEGGRILLPPNKLLRLVADEDYTVGPDGLEVVCYGGNHIWHHVEEWVGSNTEMTDPDEELPDVNDGWFRLITGGTGANLTLSGFTLRGAALSNPLPYDGLGLFRGIKSGRIKFTDMVFELSRGVALWTDSCKSYEMRRCTIRQTNRGGTQFRDTEEYVIIEDNFFDRTRDDSINVNGSTRPIYRDTRQNKQGPVSIRNNRFRASGGVRISQALQANVSDNKFAFCHVHAIVVAAVAGASPRTIDIAVERNQIRDMIRPPAPFAHAGGRNNVIEINGPDYIRTGSNYTTVPGEIDPATGTWVSPYGEETNIPVSTDPVMPSRGIRVRNNTYRRTVAPGLFSSYGLGMAWEGYEAVAMGNLNGEVDYELAEVDLRPNGITISSSLVDTEISGNDMESLNHAYVLSTQSGFTDAVMDVRFRDNRMADIAGEWLYVRLNNAYPKRARLDFRGETIDIDPNFIHPMRVSGGRWQGPTGGGGNVIYTNQVNGKALLISLEGCEVRNSARMTAFEQPVNEGIIRFKDVTLYADPVSIGNHADNRGIRVIPPLGSGFRLETVECDPTSGLALGWPKDSSLLSGTGDAPVDGEIIIPAGRTSASALFDTRFSNGSDISVILSPEGGQVAVDHSDPTPYGFSARIATPLANDLRIDYRAVKRVPASARPWEPEDSAALVGVASAMVTPRVVGGITYLDERTAKQPALAAKDSAKGSQPLYLADPVDEMPLYQVSVARRFVGAWNVSLYTTSIWYLMRPNSLSGSNSAAIFALGIAGEPGAIAIDQAVSTQFEARVSGIAPLTSNTNGTVVQDWIGQWICGEIEVTPTTLTHRINGAVYATSTHTLPAPQLLTRLSLGVARNLTSGIPSDFAHLSVWDAPSGTDRTNQIAYLKRVWGSRVTGW